MYLLPTFSVTLTFYLKQTCYKVCFIIVLLNMAIKKSTFFARKLGPFHTPNFSWAELNSNLDRPKLTKVRQLIETSNLISRSTAVPYTVRLLLAKYVIIIHVIYALGSAHGKFGVWIKTVTQPFLRRNSRPSQAGRTAGPFQIERAG